MEVSDACCAHLWQKYLEFTSTNYTKESLLAHLINERKNFVEPIKVKPTKVKMTINCKICNSEFISLNTRHKFCSKFCSNKYYNSIKIKKLPTKKQILKLAKPRKKPVIKPYIFCKVGHSSSQANTYKNKCKICYYALVERNAQRINLSKPD